MDPERWNHIEEVYHRAILCVPGERETFLEGACAGDDALRREVEALLAVSTGNRFETPALQVAAQMVSDPAGSVLTGRRIGAYQIQARIGAGGMGEVYQARDTKLGRGVAIKVLPRSFAADADRLARFEREARMLAALNHPHIATIYGTEELDGTQGLVLELVEGPTLAERIAQGPLPIKEALAVAQQIAEALEAAHEQAIVHRDLKPANIKFARSGDVKVLDFGLAKAFAGDTSSPDFSRMPTVTATELRGTILGTPAYMSPEQARGQAIDKRTDIWAFGCVLYEMMTGRVAFPGQTISDTIAAILEREPAWDTLPEATPQSVARLLRRCLEKDLKRRMRDAGDLRIDLEDTLAAPSHATSPPNTPGLVTRRDAISTVVGAVIGAAATGGVAISRYRGAVPRSLTQFAITAPENGVFVPSFNKRVAISPDGRHVAFNAGFGGASPEAFFLRSLAELESKRIKEVPSGGSAFFSPDGRWVGFITNAAPLLIRKLALSGGAAITVCPRDAFAGAAWADDDTIYFVSANPGGLLSVSAAGSEAKEVAKIDFANGERQHKYPYALPGGNAVLLTVTTADIATFDEARIVAFTPGTGQRKVLVQGGTHPRYSPSGHLLYAHDGKILAVRLDPERLEVQGQPSTVLEGVQMSRNTGVANYDVSASGDLAYVRGICDGGARTLVWVDRDGKSGPVPLPARSYLHPRLSPDDRRLAIEVEGPSHDLYVHDFERGILANITTDGVSHWPVWSPDGNELGYRSGPMGHFTLWRVPADRSRVPEKIEAKGISQNAESWSPDGRTIAYTAQLPGSGVPSSIMVAHLDNAESESLSGGKAAQGSPKFSPDGRWVAYCSNESGKPQVYVEAFPAPGPKIQISSDGGTDPVWRRTGGELYYRNGDSMMAVDVSTGSRFMAGRPRELWKGHYSHGMSSSCGPPGATSSNYDVTADGTRFLMIKDEDQDRATSKEIVVVQGWADEVSRLSART
jgi:eukaryotic-like serine/threonine-protein kinase